MTSPVLDVPLVRDTIDSTDMARLIEWLGTNPRLTKGDMTVEFERKWSEWLGVRHSVFVNSGSSANLAMIYALILSGRLKNKKIVIPALSWVTSVSPAIHLGLEPILCDSDPTNLSIDLRQLEDIFKDEDPAILMLIHPLGFPNEMTPIMELCDEYGVLMVEDSCETIGTTYCGKLMGSFGLMSTFSFYYGHHISTIEGGMVCTDDDELYKLVLSLRSHGWDRDLPLEDRKELREKYNVDDFHALYTFYHPGFNLRSTDLQAFIGIHQVDKIPCIVESRERNMRLYDELIVNDYWKVRLEPNSTISNFAYPIIHPRVIDIHETLKKSGVETRPLICGSISRQPFWIDRYGESVMEFADEIYDNGIYLPNNPSMTVHEIRQICDIVNKIIGDDIR